MNNFYESITGIDFHSDNIGVAERDVQSLQDAIDALKDKQSKLLLIIRKEKEATLKGFIETKINDEGGLYGYTSYKSWDVDIDKMMYEIKTFRDRYGTVTVFDGDNITISQRHGITRYYRFGKLSEEETTNE